MIVGRGRKNKREEGREEAGWEAGERTEKAVGRRELRLLIDGQIL